MSSNYKHIFVSNDKKIVLISDKFESANFELSDGFCKDLIPNAHRTKKFVRIIGSPN